MAETFSPEEVSSLLEQRGFGLAEHTRPHDAIDAALWERTDSLRPSNLGPLVHTTVLVRPRPRSPHPAR